MPFNLLALLLTGLCFLYYSCRRENVSREYYRNVFLLMGTGALTVPWLMDIKSSHGVLLVLVAFLAWQLLARQNIDQYHRRYILWMVFFLALSQAIVCSIQSFFPQLAGQLYEYVWLKNGGRPYGIFQQVNVVASFLASGLGCGFLLLITEKKLIRLVSILSGLGALAFILGINQSRVGELGAGVVLIGITITLCRTTSVSRLLAAWGIILATFFVGVWCANHVHFLVDGKEYLLARDFTKSNFERWNLLKITCMMIGQKPWFGWGYGSFEHAFSHYIMAHPELNFKNSASFSHPHNELLYAWFQGGVLALAGMLMLFIGWIKIVVDGFRNSPLSGAYTLLILPLLIHLNTEYPFYQSFIHFAMFILLLRVGVIDESYKRSDTSSSLLVRILYGSVALALLVFSIAGIAAGQQLTTFERNGLQAYPEEMPWYFNTQQERARFDGMVALLMDYNRTKNIDDLKEYMRQAELYSQFHNDKNILRNMIVVAHKIGDLKKEKEIKNLYLQLYNN
ncbi:Wzy polymerase domain-containing protein [Dryocola clanedunensis]